MCRYSAFFNGESARDWNVRCGGLTILWKLFVYQLFYLYPRSRRIGNIREERNRTNDTIEHKKARKGKMKTILPRSTHILVGPSYRILALVILVFSFSFQHQIPLPYPSKVST